MSERVEEELKELAVYGGLTMVKQRLTVGTWGNIGIRDRETGLNMYGQKPKVKSA